MSQTRKMWEHVKNMNLSYHFTLGPINTESMLMDPKHLAFTLSRYKFAAKMMQNCEHIVEVGCGEGIGSLVLLAETSARITGIDFDESQIKYACDNVLPHSSGRAFFVHQDIITTPYKGYEADALLSLDVIEHVHPSEQASFFENCLACLGTSGIAVFGTPNRLASIFASPRSKEGHINLFDANRLHTTLSEYFEHVFIFSMNDEMVHTGFNKLAHYLISLCVK